MPMTRNRRLLLIGGIILVLIIGGIIVVLLILWQNPQLFKPGGRTVEYLETFDEAGTWTIGQDVNASGLVTDGRYEISVDLIGDIFWITGGENFADGNFEVQTFPIEGTIDNGYGMLIRVDESRGRFYMFKVSSDGFVFIGLCDDSCLETEVLVSQDWFSSPAVNQDLEPNILRISALGPEMTFFVNDIEVGQVTDKSLKSGDIGLLAEAFAPGGIAVAFDNFKVTPIEID
jgi:hypothetical protein